MVCLAWNVRYINGVYKQSGRGSVWLERCVRDAEAGGSNPLAPTILIPFHPVFFFKTGFFFKVMVLFDGIPPESHEPSFKMKQAANSRCQAK